MITAADLAAADSGSVVTFRAALAAFLKERYPALALTGGPAADLLLAPGASALAAIEAAAEQRALAVDLEAALAAGTDPATLTDLLAARGVTAYVATKATGTAAVVVPSDIGFSLSQSTVLYATDGTEYVPTRAYRFYASTESVTPSAGEVVLTTTADSKYYGEFEITAINTGVAGNRTAGVSLSCDAPPQTNTAFYCASDITGGRDAETAAELLARLPTATAPRTTSSVEGITALAYDTFESSAAVEVVGFADTDMMRGVSSLGIITPGRCDVRIRPQGPLGRKYVTATATLVGTSGSDGIWQATIGPDECTAIAYVESAKPEDGAYGAVTYPVTHMSRGYAAADVPDYIDIQYARDAMGTAYGTVTVRFTDTETDITGLTVGVSTADYVFSVRYTDKIATFQEILNDAAVRPAGGDCLARAPTPVKVSASVTVVAPVTVDVDEDAVAAAYANGVNSTGITDTLAAASVLAAAAAALPTGAVIRTTYLAGTLYKGDGTIVSLTGSDSLQTTADALNGVGPKAMAFYLDPDDVTVTVT